MKLIKGLIATAFVLSLGAGSAFAQDGDDGDDGDLDVTMRLLPANAELPDAATREIELPVDDEGEPRPSGQGVENSAQGLEAANAAREGGRAFGEETAAAAQENRENLGRESRPDLDDLPPDNMPDIPDRPDTPGGPPGQ